MKLIVVDDLISNQLENQKNIHRWLLCSFKEYLPSKKQVTKLKNACIGKIRLFGVDKDYMSCILGLKIIEVNGQEWNFFNI